MTIKLLNFTLDFLIIKHSLPHFNILKLNLNTFLIGKVLSLSKLLFLIRLQNLGKKRSLSLLGEYFLVLIRLKVGLFISSGYVSKLFTTWTIFLFQELPMLFPFPSQQMTRKYMPKQFNSYPSTRIIIDCTEIFIEIPSSM